MEKVNMSLYKGQTYQRNLTITDPPYEITQIYFTVKDNITSKNVTLQKKLGDGIELMDIEDNVYTYLITIDSSDTNELKSGTYGYDITVKSNDIKEPIIMGDFVIEDVYTGKKEET